MKFWRVIIPNLCISLWLALLTLVILDQYNPPLGLLEYRGFLVLVILCAFSSLSCAVVLYADARRQAWRRIRKAAEARHARHAQPVDEAR